MAEQPTLPHAAQGLPPALLEGVVATFKALSDPTRAQLIYLLTAREYSANELSECVTVSASAVSHHLTKLRAIQLVRTRRDGNQIFYSHGEAHGHDHTHLHDHGHDPDHAHDHAHDGPHGYRHGTGLWGWINTIFHLYGHREQRLQRAADSALADYTEAICTVWLALGALGVKIVIVAFSGSVA